MSVRICVAFGVLLLLVNIVCGGEYQRAVDGKTLVWNNDPKPNDAVSWSGKQDKDGYATGHGTLVWYRVERAKVTGSNMPTDKRVPISSYTGDMLHGKLNGAVVAAEPSGKFYHGTFANGRRTDDWTAGAPHVRRAELVEAAPPAEGPSRAKTKKPEAPVTADQPANQPEAQPPLVKTSAKTTPNEAGQQPAMQVSDSLRSLTAPPASLRTEAAAGPAAPEVMSPPSTKSSAPAAARLNAADAIELADAEARARGYKLNEYQHPKVQYVTDSETWSVSYEPNTTSATAFNVTVDEKTKKAEIKK